MKHIKYLTLLTLSLFVISCGSDDNDPPEPVNEEEVITTVIVTLVDGSDTVILTSRDLDGDGPNAPVLTVSGNLQNGSTYNGTVQFLNETESPAENITEEVIEEADEHQVFYIAGGGLDITTDYQDMDSQGNPLGVAISLTANDISTGTLNVTLRHEPTKPNNGTLADAGGETDVSVTFDVTIE